MDGAACLGSEAIKSRRQTQQVCQTFQRSKHSESMPQSGHQGSVLGQPKDLLDLVPISIAAIHGQDRLRLLLGVHVVQDELASIQCILAGLEAGKHCPVPHPLHLRDSVPTSTLLEASQHQSEADQLPSIEQICSESLLCWCPC